MIKGKTIAPGRRPQRAAAKAAAFALSALLILPMTAFAQDSAQVLDAEAMPVPIAEPATAAAPEEADPAFILPETPPGAGAEAWYYEAMKITQGATRLEGPDLARARFLHTLAFLFGEPSAAKEAGKRLVDLSMGEPSLETARETAHAWLSSFGPDWDIYASLIDISERTGDSAGVLDLVSTARIQLPATAKARANELAWHEFSARASACDFSWTGSALSYLKAYSLDAWTSKILRLFAASPGADPDSAAVALMRADYYDRKYASAAGGAVLATSALHAPAVPRVFMSDAGKAFVNSGRIDDGIGFFLSYFGEMSDADTAQSAALDPAGYLEPLAGAEGLPERQWIAAYYVARLLLAAGRENEAGILFLALADNAPSAADADGALWYWLDITMRRIASLPMDDFSMDLETGAAADGRDSLELAALREASAHWKNASSFDDILDAYGRRLLEDDEWGEVVSLELLVGGRASHGMRTRLAYISGRLIEEGLAPDPSGGSSAAESAQRYFSRIIADEGAEEYYRTLSAWRLGMTPPFLAPMPAFSPGAVGPGPQPAEIPAADGPAPRLAASARVPVLNAASRSVDLSLIMNYFKYDLDELAASQAMKYLGSLDPLASAGLAFRLSGEEQHYAALRLSRDAIARGMGGEYPQLYELLYPKAWNALVAAGAAIPGIPEALAYGIIRSESMFNPKAVSRSGAVGLTQLMPPTAGETASGLKMQGYSLTDPADNIRIGMTYYSYMLSRFGGKPVRAMFAYNAGPTRMANWNRESGALPDDILLESLHLAEPKQYAKNIIQATLAYARIHYGIEAGAMLDYLVLARPLPAAEDQLFLDAR